MAGSTVREATDGGVVAREDGQGKGKVTYREKADGVDGLLVKFAETHDDGCFQ